MRSCSTIALLAFAPALVHGGPAQVQSVVQRGGLYQPAYAGPYAPKMGQAAQTSSGPWKSKFPVSNPKPVSAPSSPSTQVSEGGFSPDQLAFLERSGKLNKMGGSSSIGSSPSVQTNAGGFTPDQLAFLERKKKETGSVSHPFTEGSTQYAAPRQQSTFQPAAAKMGRTGIASPYASPYAPSYHGGPAMLAAQTSPSVISTPTVLLTGALVGSGLALYVARFRRGLATLPGYSESLLA